MKSPVRIPGMRLLHSPRADARSRRGGQRDGAPADRPRRCPPAAADRRMRVGHEGAARDRARRCLLLRRQRPRRLGSGNRQPGRTRIDGPGARHRPLLRQLGRAGRSVRRPRRANAVRRGLADRSCGGRGGAARRPRAHDRRHLCRPHRHCQRHELRPGGAAPCDRRGGDIRLSWSSTSSHRSPRRRSRWTSSASTSRSAHRRKG